MAGAQPTPYGMTFATPLPASPAPPGTQPSAQQQGEVKSVPAGAEATPTSETPSPAYE